MNELTKIVRNPQFAGRVGRLYDLYAVETAEVLNTLSASQVLLFLFDDLPLPEISTDGGRVEVEGQTSILEVVPDGDDAGEEE